MTKLETNAPAEMQVWWQMKQALRMKQARRTNELHARMVGGDAR